MSIDITRRSFLRGIVAVSATAVIANKLPLPNCPILYSDGFHDDAPALNALLRGDEIKIESELVQITSGEFCAIKGGNFLINNTVIFCNKRTGISNSMFRTGPDFPKSECMIYLPDYVDLELHHIIIQDARYDARGLTI